MDLLDQLLRVFGTNRVRLRWKLSAWRERARRGARAAGNRGRSLAYEHQLCPSCGHPAARDEKVCPKCGERLHGVAVARARRLLAWIVPEGMPIATAVLLAACAGLYFVTVKASYGLLGDEHPRKFAPILWILLRYGGSEPSFVVEHGEWWRVVTSVFLHADVIHLAMNGIGLWVAGQAVEERFGRARTLAAFVVTGVAGGVVSIWWRREEVGSVGVGASGAVFGLMGLLIGHALRYRGRTARELRARFVPWVIYGLIMGFAASRVDNAAHLGGLAAGGVLGVLLGDRDMRRLPSWVWNAAAIATVAVVAAAFVMAARTPIPALYQ